MSWIAYTIIATFMMAMVNIIDKYLLSKLVAKPVVPLMALGFVGGISAVVIFAIRGFSILSPFHLSLAFICGILYIFMVFFYFQAVKIEDISRIIPLYYLSPIYILFIAWIFLGERFPASKYVGILLIVSMAIVISMKNIRVFHLSRALWFIVLSSLAGAIIQVITKYLLNHNEFWTVFAYIRLSAFIVLIPVYWLQYRDLKLQFQTGGIKPFGIIAANETLTLVSVILSTAATAIGFVTLVNALSSVQPLFVLLFTIGLSIFYPQILKEELTKSGIIIKFIAIILMFIGVMLVT
jgi:drug/metabolite transporter (DMT)-like permease